MHKALYPRENVDKKYVSTKEDRDIHSSIPVKSLPKKARRKTDYSHRKQYRYYKHQQNKNNLKTKMGRKTIVWTFQETNNRNIKRENLDTSKKEKP